MELSKLAISRAAKSRNVKALLVVSIVYLQIGLQNNKKPEGVSFPCDIQWGPGTYLVSTKYHNEKNNALHCAMPLGLGVTLSLMLLGICRLC